MKKDGKYRFSLQFGADSEEQVKAGELLERLGNKKSAVVVAALNDYLNSNPDLQDTHCKIEVKLTSGYNRDGIEEIIRCAPEDTGSGFGPEGSQFSISSAFVPC